MAFYFVVSFTYKSIEKAINLEFAKYLPEFNFFYHLNLKYSSA